MDRAVWSLNILQYISFLTNYWTYEGIKCLYLFTLHPRTPKPLLRIKFCNNFWEGSKWSLESLLIYLQECDFWSHLLSDLYCPLPRLLCGFIISESRTAAHCANQRQTLFQSPARSVTFTCSDTDQPSVQSITESWVQSESCLNHTSSSIDWFCFPFQTLNYYRIMRSHDVWRWWQTLGLAHI